MPFPPEPPDDGPRHELPDDDQLSRYHGQLGRRRESLVQRMWNPAPVPRPEVDPDLPNLGWIERSATVVHYAILSIEHWLSPHGTMRELLRLILWTALILTLVSAVLVPPVSGVLQGAVEWTELTASVLNNITKAVTTLPPIVVGLASLYLLLKVLRHYRYRKSNHRGYPDGY